MRRYDAIHEIRSVLDEVLDEPGPLLVLCNGMIGREVFATGDRPGNFYMLGSMGLALSIGLGLALSRPNQEVVVFDGDGNLLMGMGTLATVGALQPRNLRHIVLDNQAHGSTGNQRTVAETVDLAAIARAAGYPWTTRLEGPTSEQLRSATRELLLAPAPAALLIRVEKGNIPDIARVTPTPREIAVRFRKVATGECSRAGVDPARNTPEFPGESRQGPSRFT